MYTTQAVCNPSRTSLLTSRRPDTSRIWDNGDTGGTAMWRIEGGNFTSLPQHFKDEGYIVLGTGKIYHPISMGFPGAFDYDRNYSWSPECLPCACSCSLCLRSLCSLRRLHRPRRVRRALRLLHRLPLAPRRLHRPSYELVHL